MVGVGSIVCQISRSGSGLLMPNFIFVFDSLLYQGSFYLFSFLNNIHFLYLFYYKKKKKKKKTYTCLYNLSKYRTRILRKVLATYLQALV